MVHERFTGEEIRRRLEVSELTAVRVKPEAPRPLHEAETVLAVDPVARPAVPKAAPAPKIAPVPPPEEPKPAAKAEPPPEALPTPPAEPEPKPVRWRVQAGAPARPVQPVGVSPPDVPQPAAPVSLADEQSEALVERPAQGAPLRLIAWAICFAGMEPQPDSETSRASVSQATASSGRLSVA